MKFAVSINDQIQESQQQMEKIKKNLMPFTVSNFIISSDFASILMGSMEKQTNTSPGISKLLNNLFQMVTFPRTLLKQVTSAYSKASQELSKIKCIT